MKIYIKNRFIAALIIFLLSFNLMNVYLTKITVNAELKNEIHSNKSLKKIPAFYDAVKKMLDEKKIDEKDLNLPYQNGNGLTPFLLACCRGNLSMVKLLLDYGAEDSQSDKRGMNAYHFLVYPRFE